MEDCLFSIWFLAAVQTQDTCEKEKLSVRAQLSGDATLGMLQRHQSPLAVPEGVEAAGSAATILSPHPQLRPPLELQLGLGKDGLSKGSWKLLLKGLFPFFLLPICKKGPRQISAACLPGIWPCLFQHLRFSGELTSQCSAACFRDNPGSCLQGS